MNSIAEKLHRQVIVVDGHNHIMIELAKRRSIGGKAVFSNYYAPLIRKGGVNVLMMCVGGDHPILTYESDLPLWGSLTIIDMVREEANESSDTMAVCLNCRDIDAALAGGKIAVLLAFEGGRPLEGKPNLNTLAGLRTFYQLGLRQIQLVDNGRNRIADGKGEARSRGGLTNFGVSVVKEMNRLGMVIDVAHLTESGFWDVIEFSEDPIIDSHSNARAICDHPRNLSDEQIKAIAKKGGVIGLSAFSSLISKKDDPTIDDFVKHVDHIVGLVGSDYVGLGPDHTEFEMKSDIWWPAPGWMEGVFYGVKDSYFIRGLNNITGFPLFTEALLKHGYAHEDIKKILGGNLLRVYRQVLG